MPAPGYATKPGGALSNLVRYGCHVDYVHTGTEAMNWIESNYRHDGGAEESASCMVWVPYETDKGRLRSFLWPVRATLTTIRKPGHRTLFRLGAGAKNYVAYSECALFRMFMRRYIGENMASDDWTRFREIYMPIDTVHGQWETVTTFILRDTPACNA